MKEETKLDTASINIEGILAQALTNAITIPVANSITFIGLLINVINT